MGRITRLLLRIEETLSDPDKTYAVVKKLVGTISGLTVSATGVSFGAFYIRQDAFLYVFISFTLAWFGYVAAHYFATGKFIHQGEDQYLIPVHPLKILGGLSGVLLLIAGVTIWILSVGRSDLITAILGACLFLAGYVIAHYEFTGDLL